MLLLGSKRVICRQVGSVREKGEFWGVPLVFHLGGRLGGGGNWSARFSGEPLFVGLDQWESLLFVRLVGIKWSGKELTVSGCDCRGTGRRGGGNRGRWTAGCCREERLRGGGCGFRWRGWSLSRGCSNDGGDASGLLVRGSLKYDGEGGGGRFGGGGRRHGSAGKELGHLEGLQLLQFHHQLLDVGQELIVLLVEMFHSRLEKK